MRFRGKYWCVSVCNLSDTVQVLYLQTKSLNCSLALWQQTRILDSLPNFLFCSKLVLLCLFKLGDSAASDLCTVTSWTRNSGLALTKKMTKLNALECSVRSVLLKSLMPE